MATGAGTMPAHQQQTFNNIFSGIQPPVTKRLQSEPSVSRLTDQLAKQLKSDAQTALGIDNERYVYKGTGFKPHFATCPSMLSVTVPTYQQRSAWLSTVSKSDSISRLPTLANRLGTLRIKKVFAGIIDSVLADFVGWSYGGVYHDEVRAHLRFWIEHILASYVKIFLYSCDAGTFRVERVPSPTQSDLENWHAMAMRRLYDLRADELFDMAVDWPKTSAGVDDLRLFLGTPQSRLYVIEKFGKSLQTRLLHPGASTVEILRIYVSIIRASRRLDPRGVLLGRVSARLRQYLRERDDTVRVVVAGLLSDVPADPDEHTVDQANSDILSELAWELQHRDPGASKHGSGLDWNNMSWVPDPVDAAPDNLTTRGAKQSDVIGSIISLFESKEVFVKELQNVLAERLLRNKDDYDQETSVIEHLKIRFGDTALQACEVMLRDVLDSRRLDAIIRRDQGLHVLAGRKAKGDNKEPEVHAKILSRLFWPALPGLTGTTMGAGLMFGADDDDDEEKFRPPVAIAHQRHLYEKGFEALKQTRKLSWNDTLGQVDIEITFADGRTYTDEVLPYQAGVIYAFQDDNDDDELAEKGENESKSKFKMSASSKKPATSKTIQELSSDLHLSPALIRSACLLFVSKKVLTTHPSNPDLFTVLEYLPPQPTNTSTAIDPSTQNPSTNPNLQLSSSPSSHPHPPQNPAAVGPAPSDLTLAQAEAASTRAAELAAAAAAREAESREKKAKLAVYQQFVVAMLTNQGAMPLPRIQMMLGIVVPGGFPFSADELRELLAGMVRDGVVENAGGIYKKR